MSFPGTLYSLKNHNFYKEVSGSQASKMVWSLSVELLSAENSHKIPKKIQAWDSLRGRISTTYFLVPYGNRGTKKQNKY